MTIGSTNVAGTEYPEHTVYQPDSDTYLVPFIANDGRVGYRVGRVDHRPDVEAFVYFSPSEVADRVEGENDDPCVFVYFGIENDPGEDAPEVFITYGRNALGI